MLISHFDGSFWFRLFFFISLVWPASVSRRSILSVTCVSLLVLVPVFVGSPEVDIDRYEAGRTSGSCQPL